MEDQRFKVHLKGIIELLSQHLYSSPAVYVRELLQNATDAIAARRRVEPDAPAEVRLDVLDGVLTVTDTGVGLREAEIHEFLATIGASSKRDDLEGRRGDFLGQFGIGLLSCFLVADQIEVRTRSVRGGDTWAWTGSADGSYTLAPATEPLAGPGTEVRLRFAPDARATWTRARVAETAGHYGAMLPFPVWVGDGATQARVNPHPYPWRDRDRAGVLAWGVEILGQPALDAIPLRAQAGGVDGVAFLLPHTPHFGARQKHRVYLRGMLLSEDAETLLPDWAFFVRCVVNATDLRPTASREGFYEDAALARARDELGGQLRAWLLALARERPQLLQDVLRLHALSMKALALDDDDFFTLVAPWFTVETTAGVLRLGDLFQRGRPLRYCPTLEGYRQVARVASAQGLTVVNAAYTHDTALMEKLGRLRPELEVTVFSAQELPQRFEELDHGERRRVQPLVKAGDRALGGFGVGVEVRRFLPADVPALYADDEASAWGREVARTREGVDELFGGLLDELGPTDPARPLLYLNLDNPVVRRLAELRDPALTGTLVEILYVQALLLAQRPLRSAELAVLNRGLGALVAAVLEREGGMDN